MKIIVLGGSPKGSNSVTMQYVEYLQKRHPEIEWDLRQPALRITRIEKNEEAFDSIIKAVHSADAVLWAFPLYVHGVCSQYQRFIELIEERDKREVFSGKAAAALTTSIKFFDNTAHDYIRAVSEDLGMGWAGNHSAHMHDLTLAEGRSALDAFTCMFISAIETGVPFIRQFVEAGDGKQNQYEPVSPLPPEAQKVSEYSGKRIAIVADTLEGSLGAMVKRLAASFTAEEKVTVTNLREIRIAGGCMGCLKCGPANDCAWDGKDDVRKVYEEEIGTADLYVMATTVKGRWHSALMKSFVDRGFYHTHQPFLTGKQMIVLLDGSLAKNPPLKDYLESYSDWEGATLTGIIASGDVPPGDSASLDAAIDHLARQASTAIAIGYRKPRSFRGIAGLAIFRDEIFGHLRMVFRADHKAYRKNGVYRTMIQKQPLKLLGYRIMGALSAIPFIQKKMISNMRNFMLMPYKSVLSKTRPAESLISPEIGKGGTPAA